ncbi:glycosyl hydrolase [Pedobacter frigiditerrae]|uniref:glycosyl hydrolase n=1 Tax=Pedobacter frigiditerrae TaxID=2530452 RepID=UPI002930AD2D|nr:glycosyl hydrolase [Pedobacter frigiditerrae]
MKLHRRRFLQLGSITLAGIPLSKLTAQAAWYDHTAFSPKEDLYELFKNPKGAAKPFVRWWWNGNRVVKAELLRELDILKAAGVGGVEINSIRFPDTSNPLNYKEMNWLSDEWLDMLKTAVEGAKQRGLVCDIIMGSGWPFGAEFLTKDEQTQMMALGTKDFTGPQTIEVNRADLLKLVDPALASKNKTPYKELSFLRLAPASLKNPADAIDLDSKINQEIITLNIPEGKHVLYFLVKITGYMNVIYGAPGANGPVLNHYNKIAVEMYLNKLSDAIKPKLGSMGNLFRSVFVDSLELQGANWCDDFEAEFDKRRGYALRPHLPFILFKTGTHGRPINEVYGAQFSSELQDQVERIRFDFETTKMELFKERFLDVFLTWCKQNGVLSRVQAYGREYHPSDSSMSIDIPECETWMRKYVGEDLKDYDYTQGRTYSPVNKFVASGAKLSGKKLVSCEEITNTEVVFNATMEMIKLTGDQSNLSGVNHSIIHGFNYSPPDAPFPGWVRYGTFVNERNPINEFFKLWIAYKARLSTIFQEGEMRSDIALMHPLVDLWSKYSVQWDPFPEKAFPDYAHNVWEAIHQNGGGCDYVSEYVLQNSKSANGKLTYGPRIYKTLIVVELETMHPDTAKSISNYIASGGKVIFIGKQPSHAPGLKGKAMDKQVLDTIKQAKQKYPTNAIEYPSPTGEILTWYKDLQTKAGIKPFIKIDKPSSSVSQVYYKYGALDCFFISNYSKDKRHEFNAEFDVALSKTAWIWNAEDGSRMLYPTNGASNKLHIPLGPAESKLIVFDENKTGKKYSIIKPNEKTAITISTPWKLSLNHLDGSTKQITLAKLVDFKDDVDLSIFGGVAIYENTVNVTDILKANYLDLGKVHGVCELIINGKSAGVKWYGDRIYSLGGLLKLGSNSIVIKITTTMGNYVGSLKTNKDSIKWIKGKNQPVYSNGMLGPVRLMG